ncbi:MAG: peptidoglycan-binding protein [Bryobacterales bacterium]|nr:peptidoglycan-binding protein [Bryobacterales bacterium]
MPGYRTIGAGVNLIAIAEEEGFWAETIWQHGENAELRKQRQFYNVLAEDDRVYVPEKRPKAVGCVTDRRHVFRRKGIPALLKLRVLVENKPCADRRYSLLIDGVEYTGVTDGEGRLQHHVPAGARRGQLLLEGSVTVDLTLSALQPVSGVLGVQNRLRNLGFYRGPRDGELNNETREAIRRVQAHFDRKETGAMDGKLRELLEQLHDRSSEHLKEDKDYG